MSQFTTTVIKCDNCPNKTTLQDARGVGVGRTGAYTHVTFPGDKAAQDFCQTCWSASPEGKTPLGDSIEPGVDVGGF